MMLKRAEEVKTGDQLLLKETGELLGVFSIEREDNVIYFYTITKQGSFLKVSHHDVTLKGMII